MATQAVSAPALHEIQGLVRLAFGFLPYSGYLMLHVTDAGKARAWLASHYAEVTTSESGKKYSRALNLAFTHAGLAALGVAAAELQEWPDEFTGGPAAPARALMLGDCGASAPEHWDFGAPHQDAVHLVAIFFAETEQDRDAYYTELTTDPAEHGLRQVGYETAYRPLTGVEHFGFADGLSQPIIRGISKEADKLSQQEIDNRWDVIRPGEILFGYENEYTQRSPVPGSEQLGFNGSFLVIRKLEQDVPGFEKFLNEAAKGDPKLAEWIGAKMFGRWKSGASLAVAPDAPQDHPPKEPRNDFLFAEDDPHGYKTPVGSHIRRANPRDSLEPNPAESIKTVKRHAIVRRGRAYGPAYDGSNPDERRGLFFICLNTDIKRQFEFIQQAWTNDASFNGLVDNKDPIMADRNESRPYTTMSVPAKPYAHQLLKIPQFVTTRGAAYFFLPGMAGLRYIIGM
jgi:Dyp-type peroxidase family